MFTCVEEYFNYVIKKKGGLGFLWFLTHPPTLLYQIRATHYWWSEKNIV